MEILILNQEQHDYRKIKRDYKSDQTSDANLKYLKVFNSPCYRHNTKDKIWRNINEKLPACSFRLWSVGSESFSYPWCFAVAGTNDVVSQVEKGPPGGWETSADYHLLLQPKNSHTVMHQRIRAHTHFSAQVRWGNEIDFFYRRAVGEEWVLQRCMRLRRSSVHRLLNGDKRDKLVCSCRHFSPDQDETKRERHKRQDKTRRVREINWWYLMMGILHS